MGDKEELLAAIAAAGSQGKADYEAAKAQQAAQQQQAIQGALAGAAATTTPEMQNYIAGIVGKPYDAGSTYLDANQQAYQKWSNEAQWNTGVFQGNLEKLREALVAQAYAQAAADASGSGSKSGKGKEPGDWYDNLKDQFGTAALGFDAIAQEAKALGLDSKNPELAGMPRYMQTRGYATNEYGVPEGIAAEKYGPSEYGKAIMADVNAVDMNTAADFRAFVQNARASEKSTPGSQRYWTQEAKKRAMARLPKKARKKIKRGRK